MKKICFVTTVSVTLDAFVLKTAKYLHENTDWDISFICSYDKEFADKLPEYIHYFPVSMKRGISVLGIKAMIEMKRIFVREKFDLIQYSTPNASLYAAIAGWLAKVPVRLYCQWGIVYVGLEGLMRKIFKFEEKLVCKLSTEIEPDSISNLDFSHDEGLYPESVGTVIWNGSACGVDLEKFDIRRKQEYRERIRKEYKIDEDDFVFGFVGRITKDKGINELLGAFRKVVVRNDNVVLLIVGKLESDETLDKELFEWAQESSNVIFSGYTNVVEQFISAMDTYILPSYREGFGMGVVEAEAMGVPVIVTDIPGPIDAMVDSVTGIMVRKKDVESLCEAMTVFLQNPVIVEEYGKNAICHAKKNFEQGEFFRYLLEDRKKLLNA